MTTSFPTRRSYGALAVVFIGFAIYASLIPFNARPLSLAEATEGFLAAMAEGPRRVSRSDVLANTLLFVPVGFTLTGALLSDRVFRWRTAASAPWLVLLVSILASLTAEFVQMFTPNRRPAPSDVVAQTVGCAVGVVAWMVAGRALTAWIRRTLASTPADRLPRVLATYVVAWIFVGLAPFDITVDVSDLGRRVRTGDIGLWPSYPPSVASTRLLWDSLVEILATIPVGAAALLGWPNRRGRRVGAAITVGTALVVLVECAQIFVNSHAGLATDALLGSLGVAIGAWAGRRLPQPQPTLETETHAWVSKPAVAALLVWCFVLVLYHWQPYDFSVDRRSIQFKLGRISLVPFAGYVRGRWINALNDILTKVSLAVPLGVIAAFVFRRRANPSPLVVPAWALLFATVFGVVEFGQLFVPTRNPDPTDILTGTAGALCGLMVSYWLYPGGRKNPPA